MNRFSRCCCVLLMLTSSASLADEGRHSVEPQGFLKSYCIRCHGPDAQKADRRFDNLPARIVTLDDMERYQEIVDQLNLASMPPEDELQPSAAARRKIIERVTGMIAEAQAGLSDTGGHSVLRRLNSWEYRQTIGDLLGLNVEVWDPAADFPAEVMVDGFDNNGAGLVTSGMLLNHYLSAAEEAIRRATNFGPRPESKNWSQNSPFYFSGKESRDLPKLFQVDRFRFIPDTPYTDLYGRHYRGGHIGFLPLVRQGGVKQSGQYTVRVRAAAVSRRHDYGKALGDFRNGDPLVMELAAVDRRGSVESTGNVSEMTSLARIELTEAEPQWFEWDVYIEAGFEPEVRFRNGPMAAKRMVRLLTTQAADRPEFQPFVHLKGGMEKAHGVLKAYQGPRLRVWEIELQGPHVEAWPPQGHQLLYGKLALDEITAQTIPGRIDAFAKAAFRREPVDLELEPIQTLVDRKLSEGMEPLDALKLGFQAILCSPGFLYLNMGEGELDDTALASRLAYFLSSSPPDETLSALAAKGELRPNLESQAMRLTGDPKIERFVHHFVRRWLDLDNIGAMPPAESFLTYYRDNLQAAMEAEIEAFFRHLLERNAPLSEFLAADYAFLNRELALHYGIEGVSGNELRQVKLPKGKRGGLLSQGAFLTASANGVDTSPVVRGVYVLEKVLGYRPPPPPPDVPAIEPDIRGAVTIREQLKKHRQVETCAECHRKIDPLGFALENFDAIGMWRNDYAQRVPIDATGKLINGEAFSGFGEFRDLMIAQSDQFSRCLTEKLMAYALGRELEVTDRPDIDEILMKLKSQDGGLRDLILLIVQSKAFGRN
ncbi:MAG: DUF1592 domain-containing protein [Rubripirellula sp.]